MDDQCGCEREQESGAVQGVAIEELPMQSSACQHLVIEADGVMIEVTQ